MPQREPGAKPGPPQRGTQKRTQPRLVSARWMSMVSPIRSSAIPNLAELPDTGPSEPLGEDEQASLLGLERSLEWYVSKVASEAACALPCNQALGLAKLDMPDAGLAEKMLDHFRSGAAQPVRVDLDREFERNPELRQFLTSQIEVQISMRPDGGEGAGPISGAVWVSQADYGQTEAGRDQSYALGGTYFEWEVLGSDANGGLLTRVNVSDHYFWSPHEERPTQCLHACGAALVAAGEATEFHQFGEGHLSVSLPRSGAPMSLPDLMPRELR